MVAFFLLYGVADGVAKDVRYTSTFTGRPLVAPYILFPCAALQLAAIVH